MEGWGIKEVRKEMGGSYGLGDGEIKEVRKGRGGSYGVGGGEQAVWNQ